MRFKSYRRYLPLILAVAVGLALAVFATKQMMTYVNTHRETVRVPVPAHNIAPYTVIGSGDLTWREVVKGGEDPGAVRDPGEAVGKIALSPLYKGEQIRKERLGDAELLAGRQVVSVSVDLGRCVGGTIKPGDLADVWWVDDSSTPGLGWTLVASDAVVLDVRDSSGKSVVPAEAGLVQALGADVAPAGPPAVAVLAVKEADVSRVVGGALPKSQNIVLAKKFAPGGSVVPQSAAETAAEEEGEQEKEGGQIEAGQQTGTAENR